MIRQARGLFPLGWERAVLVIAGLVIVGSLAGGSADLVPLLRDDTRTMAVYFAVIVLGELSRVRMPSGRISAPIASGAGTALVLTRQIEGEQAITASAGALVVACAVGFAVGMLLRRVLGFEAALYVVAARLIGVAIVARLARGILFDGHSLVEWPGRMPPWLAAVALGLAAAAGLFVELVLTGMVRAERLRASWFSALRDELVDVLGLTTALITTGPLIALLQPVLGLAALPLSLFPMALTYVAVHRYVTNRLTYRQTIVTLSRLTEAGGYTPLAHAERVAHLSVQIGRHLGLVERDLRDVEYGGLLHDLGQIALREPIPGGATVLAAPADQQRIAIDGANIIRRTPVLARVARYVESQAAPYRLVRELDHDIPVASRIIKVANAFDDLTAGNPSPSRRNSALERIQLGMGYEYDPEIVEALAAIIAEGSVPWQARALRTRSADPPP